MDTDRRSTITPDVFHSIIAISIDGFLLVDLEGNIVETNDSYCKMVGYSRDELLNLQIHTIDAIDNKDDVARRLELIIQNGSLRFETKHLNKDGTIIHVEVSANYSASHGGAIFSFIRDVTIQKRTHQIMDVRLRLIEFSLTHSLSELLRQTLDEAELLTGSCIGFYHFKDPDSQILTLQAWSTKTAAMFCKAEGSGSHYPVSEAGVWVDCVHERRPVIHNDYASLSHKKGLPDGHAAVIRELVVPIFRHDKIVAIMGIGNKATDYTQQDVEFISTLADLAWDVAIRKKAEEDLQQSEERFQSLIMSANDGIILQERSGKILIWNKAAERIFGICASDIVGQKSTDRSWKTYTEDGALLPGAEHPSMLALSSGKPSLGTTLRVERDTGDHSWIVVNANPIFNVLESAPNAVAITFTDITERKRTEDTLQESEFRWKFALEGAGDGVWDWNIKDGKAYYSTRYKEMLGFAEDEIGTTSDEWLKRIHPDDVTGVMTALKPYLDGKHGTASVEFRMLCKNGNWKSILGRGMVVSSDRDGKPLRMIGTNTDLTERKAAEQERHTMELQMLQAQKLESLGVLAGGIAHDFNNILMAIMGNADLALMRINKESPAVENLHRIEQASARAADLAKQMLAYSGKGKFVVENIDLNILVEEMLHMLEVSVSKKAVLRLNLHTPLPTVEADATQMRQIIMNLVINASEAIGDKSGVIAITTGCMDCDRSYLSDVWLDENINEGLYVYLEIADSGCGMSKETLAKLFDPFFTTKFTGRGLGMAAVLGIVRGHKGAIKVYSEPKRGTTFKILLPASSRPVEIFNGASRLDDWQGEGTVLLVDDEETVRGVGSEMLKELGYTVITADDGREGVVAFRNYPGISFVILDLTMPHMDGEQCFRELRQIKPDVKVIMSSGYNEQEVAQRFVGKGLAGFIQKPYKLSTLREAILKI